MIYLAYGSNLHIEHMQQRCPTAEVLGTSTLLGYRLVFNGVATIEPDPDRSVPVLLWDIKPADEIPLDRYEGCPVCYYKKEISLPVRRAKSGRTLQTNGFLYIMNEKRRLGEPTPRYFWTCVQGYRSFGFDPEFLYEAYERSTRHLYR